MRLDFGCGKKKKEGFIGVDFGKTSDAEIICNCEHYPLPFNDNTIDEVYSSHFLEHIADPNAFLIDLMRIMKPGAEALIHVPNHQYSQSWVSSHKWQPAMPYLRQMIEARGFQVISIEKDWCAEIQSPTNPFHEMWKKNPDLVALHLWNVVWQLRIKFKKP